MGSCAPMFRKRITSLAISKVNRIERLTRASQMFSAPYDLLDAQTGIALILGQKAESFLCAGLIVFRQFLVSPLEPIRALDLHGVLLGAIEIC
ncbi:MAG: hypothetical protein AAB342_01975, partial [Chloroflexota bacterium]